MTRAAAKPSLRSTATAFSWSKRRPRFRISTHPRRSNASTTKRSSACCATLWVRTVCSRSTTVCDHLGADASELLRHRFGIVNVWRPIRGPVVDSPLALCDAQSFTDDDLIATDLVYPHVRGETSSVEYNPRHRWYYFSEMQTDEVVLIRVHDSANDGRARLSFHTSFDNPLASGAPPRESIEVRALVFFPPSA